MTTRQYTLEEEVNIVLQTYELDRLVPKVVLENEWISNNTVTYSFYISKPSPKYNLSALRMMFRDVLIRDGIDPNSRVKVGGKAHNCRNPRPVLSLKEFYINPAMLKGYKRVKARRLVMRWKERGFTIMFWNRAVRLIVFKDHHLGAYPAEFMYQLLVKMNYTRYIALWILTGNRQYRIRRLTQAIEQIKFNEARGWRMVL